jgi:hypothetical protein
VTRTLFAAALTLALTAPLVAQEKPAPSQERAAMVSLRLDLVISRTAGEKKISTMPYTMWLTANAPGRNESSLRMGVQVPVPTTVMRTKEGADPQAVQSYQYRDVGTNIDATASSAEQGRFAVAITLNDSGLNNRVEGAVEGAPLFRNFQSRFNLLLRDGQTATYTSATDPVTGETLSVQATLTVLK